jgi:hypothetical protein
MTMTLRRDAGQTGRRPVLPFRAAAVATAAIALALTAVPRGALSAESPFSALSGSWSGDGTIKKTDGGSERIRCRAAYTPTAGSKLQLRLRCASDSYNFDLGANVAYEGGTISGTWNESTRQATGSIQGRSTGNGRQIQAIARGIIFTANLTMNTRGDKQSITILAPGTDIAQVDIALNKQ